MQRHRKCSRAGREISCRGGAGKPNEIQQRTSTEGTCGVEETEDPINTVAHSDPRSAANAGERRTPKRHERHRHMDAPRKDFEYTAKGQRTQELHMRWEGETLQPGEHPELLYIRLVTLQRQLAALGDNLSQNNLTRKFLAAVRNGNDKIYGPVIREYNRDLVRGRPLELNQLLELLALEYRQVQYTPGNSEVMTRLAVNAQCTHCNRMGHYTEDCWNKYPRKKPRGNETRSKGETRKCFKCGKVGHLRRNCKNSSVKEGVIASLKINENISSIDCYKRTYVDSASSCHTITSLQLLDDNTAQRINRTVRAVDGTVITLTHKGRRTIHTPQGIITGESLLYSRPNLQ